MNAKIILKQLLLISVCLCVIECNLIPTFSNFPKNQKMKKTHSESVALAILDLIDKFFLQRHESFHVSIFGKITPEINDILYEIGRRVHESFAVKIRHCHGAEVIYCADFKMSSVILASDMSTLNEVLKYSKLTNDFLIPYMRFIIYCEKWNKSQHFKKIYRSRVLSSGRFSFHKYIVTKSNKSYDLLTTKYFTESSCYEEKLEVVDTFDLETKKWPKDIKGIENGWQFNGCRVPINYESSLREGFIKLYNLDNWQNNDILKDTKLGFGTGDLLHRNIHEAVGKIGNFTPHFLRISKEHIIPDQNGMLFEFFEYKIIRHIEGFMIQPVYTAPSLLFATPREHYTNYEKIFFPFDLICWILFTLAFGITFVATFIINAKRNSRCYFRKGN